VRHTLADAVLGLAAAALALLAHAWLDTVELKTYDWRMQRTARPDTTSRDIALVTIDEYSLRNLQANAGRWPWPPRGALDARRRGADDSRRSHERRRGRERVRA